MFLRPVKTFIDIDRLMDKVHFFFRLYKMLVIYYEITFFTYWASVPIFHDKHLGIIWIFFQ